MKPAAAKTCPSCAERYEADVLFCPRDGTPLVNAKQPSSFANHEADPYLGLELAGQIRIKHLIGVGSMGRVYRAFQAGIDRDVAVKILHRELSGNPELVARFHREAKVASRLVHPNVVQVLMTGAVPFGSEASRRGAVYGGDEQYADPRVGGELYLVMEHLDGMSLLSALAAAGTSGESAALPLPRALHIVLQLCDAVGEAHTQGIVHRDMKPENVMLIPRGDDPDFVKVLDFGIARLDWADRGMATQAGLIFGTAKYISPEGAEGQRVGPAADCYSIATILYQCLAGRTPFEGDSPVALLVQHTHAPPPDLRSIARSSYVPSPIAEVLMQNLAKRPAERAPNARVLGRELMAAVRASGLDPEEIVQQSGLVNRSSGAVKLASNQRTKALDLSPELAARIGGVAPLRASEAISSGQPGLRESARPHDRGFAAYARGHLDDELATGDENGETITTVPGEPHWLGPPEPLAQTLNEANDALDDAAFPPRPGAPHASPSNAPTPLPGARGLSAPARAAASPAHAAGWSAAPPRGNVSSPPGALTRSVPPGTNSRGPLSGHASGTGSHRPLGGHAPGTNSRGPLGGHAPGTNSRGPLGEHAPGTAGARAAGAALPAPELDFDDAEPRRISTMQGTETTLSSTDAPSLERRRLVHLALGFALAAGIAVAVFLGGRQLGGFGAAAGGDSLEVQIESARDCMRRHAWDAPSRQNLKEITDAALTRWPGDARVQEVRREASERLVADALGRKYAGDKDGAIHLLRLALQLDPAMTTAQHFAAELEGAAPDVAPVAADSAEPEKAPPRAGARRGVPSAAPRLGASGAPAAGSATLPPSPPQGDLKPLPAPTGTGPWL